MYYSLTRIAYYNTTEKLLKIIYNDFSYACLKQHFNENHRYFHILRQLFFFNHHLIKFEIKYNFFSLISTYFPIHYPSIIKIYLLNYFL